MSFFYMPGQVFTLRIKEEELSFMPQSLAVPTEYKAEEKKLITKLVSTKNKV